MVCSQIPCCDANEPRLQLPEFYRQEGTGKRIVAGQIFFGSVVLGICSLLHVTLVSWIAGVLFNLSQSLEPSGPGLRRLVVLAAAFGGVLISHTIQVWFWAFCIVQIGALPNMDESLYFSLVTYTALGYGDVTLSADFQIFGAMAAVTGLLNFGLSTAFLVGAFGRLVAIRDEDENQPSSRRSTRAAKNQR